MQNRSSTKRHYILLQKPVKLNNSNCDGIEIIQLFLGGYDREGEESLIRLGAKINRTHDRESDIKRK